MPRGGPRPGAGRPKGSASKGKKASASKADTKKTGSKAKASSRKATPRLPGPPPTDKVFEGEVLPANLSPLEYMLGVMNNPNADPDRRDRMAVAAGPYVHGKMGEKGKKDSKRDAAAQAGGAFASTPPPPRPSRVN